VITGLYVRKSTEQSGVADEAKSVTRQIEHARAYAVRKGWTVDDRYVYVDDGVSGAEFVKRPGFARLMNALKPRAPFDVLIMSEESRLGREQVETAYALKQLTRAGVRVWLYLDDRELLLETPTDKLLMSVTAFADELERERARQRTYDALVQKARSGYATGGRVFGYDNHDVTVEADGARAKRSHVIGVVNADEAAIVRRIFELAASGMGLRKIAITLNDARALAPLPRRKGRSQSWAPSSVREILHRDLYRGVIVWGRTRKRDRWGVKKETARPRDEWLRVDAPELRIVADELWNAAHGRLDTARRAYRRSTRGVLHGRAQTGFAVGAKYLLSGLARCGLCGAGFIVRSRASGAGRRFVYACGHHHRARGERCAVGGRAPTARPRRGRRSHHGRHDARERRGYRSRGGAYGADLEDPAAR
jgi:site-specific DNA recombinase